MDNQLLLTVYSGMSVIRTSDIWTRQSTERPSNSCFLINAHIPWHQLHEKTALHVPRLIVGGLALSNFAVQSSSLLHLWPCLRCGSEDVVCNSSKTKALCAEYKLQTYGIFIVTDRVQSRHIRITWHSTVIQYQALSITTRWVGPGNKVNRLPLCGIGWQA